MHYTWLSRVGCLTLCSGAVFMAPYVSAPRELHTDQFDRAPLDPSWTFLAPDGGSYEIRDGWVHITSPGLRNPMAWDGDRAGWPVSPLLLIEPPEEDVFTFETRLRFQKRAHWAHAGLVATRKDHASRMILSYYPTLADGVVVLDWRVGVGTEGAGNVGVGPTGDVWLRVELPRDMPLTQPRFFYRRGGGEESWTLATKRGGARPFELPNNLDPRFLPGEYWIGLFATGGLVEEADEEVVAFDYFHSPEMAPLTVEPGATAATVWASLRRR